LSRPGGRCNQDFHSMLFGALKIIRPFVLRPLFQPYDRESQCENWIPWATRRMVRSKRLDA
jgi:hypothetical protein